MKKIQHTLVSDGPTDANLIPILNWALKQIDGVTLADGVRAELWRLPNPPNGLAERLATAVELHPCDVLFVHRDAEKQSPSSRVIEIRKAFDEISTKVKPPVVAVVPVRMLESWLCFDESAIRRAAGNPNGQSRLNLPPLARIESRPDPKEDLKQALRDACELSGRRLKKFDTSTAFWRIVDCIEDFSPLRALPAFQSFESSIGRLKSSGWKPGFYG
jgi:hypothetical protein